MTEVALNLVAVFSLTIEMQSFIVYDCQIFNKFGVVMYLILFCAFFGRFIRMHDSPVCTLTWLKEHNVS